MSQSTALTLNNNHLLKAAMAFVVVGMAVPGLFQLQPPQWFDGSEAVVVEVLEPLRDGESYAAHIQPDEAVIQRPAAPPATVPVPRLPKLANRAVPEDAAPNPAAPQGAVTKLPPAIAAVAAPSGGMPSSAKPDEVILSGPNSADVSTQLAALNQQPGIPEKPAVRARVVVPKPTPTPEVTPRASKLPAIPKTAPVPVIVSRDFTRRIPDSHVGLPVKQQKESFVAIILPLVLAANEEISQRRSAIRRAAKAGDRPGLERWAKLYRVNTDAKSIAELEADILIRADQVPVSLALAQAAIESGWGTSRFARQGNALFGQWAWQASAGIKPAEASNSRAVVRSFPNLFGSVRAYMHNLNTHPSYATFRDRRHLLRGRQRADRGFQLANFLDSYAEIGTAYVDKLQTLIRSNDFGRFETARLR
ncbi:MAG: glucosaminidase domain-containing protein [Candidatus Puniceispirillaceae bacterium]